MHDGNGAGPTGADGAEEPVENQGGHDIDAEFAAMMEGLELPAEMQADLAALDEAQPSDDADRARADEGAEDADAPERNATGGAVHTVSADDVPHNTYRAPGEEHGSGLSAEQEAEIAALAAALDAAPTASEDADGESGTATDPTAGAKAVKVAVVLSPLASADALAALCAMSELECVVVPARSGAFAVKEFVSAHAEWDVTELLGGEDSEPAEAAELASSLSRLSRAGVVLLTADLATAVGIESGLSGTITARRYQNTEAGEEASAGLILAAVDQVVEDVLLGVTRAEEAPGAIRTQDVKPGRAMRLFGRGLRRPKGGSED